MTRQPTYRQWQVAALLAEGLSQKQVADRMHISRTTVRNHVHGTPSFPGLYERTGTHNNQQVAVWWWTWGRFVQPFNLRLPEAP